MDLTMKELRNLESPLISPAPIAGTSQRAPSSLVSTLEPVASQGQLESLAQFSGPQEAGIHNAMCMLQLISHLDTSFFGNIADLKTVYGFESSNANIDHFSMLGDGLSADCPEVLAIDPAMEHFLSEYLQGD